MRQTLMNQVTSWREGRRFRADALPQAGWKPQDSAAALGVTPGAVSQWLKRARAEGGIVALRRRPMAGPQSPCRLTAAQWAKLPELLAPGAAAFGFRGDVWTHPRGAALREREFGVRYYPTHAGRLLVALGWPRQQPVVRATQRNAEAIQPWRTERWPALEQTRRLEGRTIVFVDAVGFDLLPGRVRSYGPKGAPPLLRAPLTRDHLAAIGGITLTGRLLVQVQERAFNGFDVVRLLGRLLRQAPGKRLVVWDGAPIHRCRAVKDFHAAGAAHRLHRVRILRSSG